jgi:hypothetical protein
MIKKNNAPAGHKKKYRVIGVPRPKDIKAYAAKIEDAMNEMHAAGYAVQLSDEKNGVVLLGQLSESQQNPIVEILQNLGAQPQQHAPSAMSPRTDELVSRFRYAGKATDIEGFRVEARKQASSLIQGFSASELATAVEEILKEADAHEKTHKPGSDCLIPETLRALSEILKQTMQLQLQ